MAKVLKWRDSLWSCDQSMISFWWECICVGMSESMSTCGQGQAEWCGMVVIVGTHIMVGWMGFRVSGVMGAHSLKTFN